jgi:methylated-DNA-[protein]-cysteine S-methyltransferase
MNMDTHELARRAAEEGLLDVAYTTVDAPFGRMLVATTPRGLVRTAFQAERDDDVLTELADRISPRVLEAPARLDGVRRELDEYFEGRLTEFSTPIDWQLSHGFLLRAREACAAIKNPIPIVVPCHRVLRTGGGLGGYGGGLECKRWLLDLESGVLTL